MLPDNAHTVTTSTLARLFPVSFMQRGLSDIFNASQQTTAFSTQTTIPHHGSPPSATVDHGHRDLPHQQQHQPGRPFGDPSCTVQLDSGIALVDDDGVDASALEERLRGLSAASEDHDQHRPKLPGQRIAEYENALTPSAPTQAPGFRVIKRSESPRAGMLLSDFPNGS